MSQDETTPTTPIPTGVIKITAAEANSMHVDDLLKRQASLRGEGGITRDTGRKWYYQNWFVLMIAGLVFAVIGWAILLPFLQDRPYLQGKIEALGPPVQSDPLGVSARLTVAGREYPILADARQMTAGGKWGPLALEDLKVGDQVGLYVSYLEDTPQADLGQEPYFYVEYLVPHPAPSTHATDDIVTALHNKSMGFMLFFPLVAGMVGLGIGAADGLMCRLPRRMLLAGGIGLLVGLIGGFLSGLFADLIYAPITHLASQHTGGAAGGLSTFGFLLQILGRSLGWAVAGTTMGLGQGLALRSGKVVIYGVIGGLLGGLLGGILFDPIFFLFTVGTSPEAHLSRLVSISVLGLSVGLMIGVVELLARDAWLRMAAGPLAGKEFLIFKNQMRVGASPRSDVYLFNDPGVAPHHATIRATGDLYEIESASSTTPVTVNGRTVNRARLRHGDQIGLGRTMFVFQRKTG